MIARLPAAENFRFGLGDSFAAGAGGSGSPLILAHLASCAIAIFRLEAALNLLRLRFGASGAAAGVSVVPPVNRLRSSEILASSLSFCVSIPKIAAFKISVVSFGIGTLLDLPRFFHRKDDAEIHTTLTITLSRQVVSAVGMVSPKANILPAGHVRLLGCWTLAGTSRDRYHSVQAARSEAQISKNHAGIGCSRSQ